MMAGIGFWYIRDIVTGPNTGRYPVRALITDSFSYYAGNYLSFFRGDGDSLLVTAFLGPVALADYYVAKTLYTNVGLICTAIDKVAAERLARHIRTPQFNEKAHELHVRISSAIIPLCLLSVAIAPEALFILAGPRYADATWPAVVLLLAMLVQFVSIPYDRAVYVALPAWIRLKYTTIEAFLAVIAVAALAPLAGLIGVAAARTVAPLGVCVFGAWILRRHLDLVLPVRPIVLSFAIGLPGTVAALLAVPASHSVWTAIGFIALATAIWAASFVGIGLLLNRPQIEALFSDVRHHYRRVLSGSGISALTDRNPA
jgi:O-antigen/teichoic acid export membrane protein